MNDYTKWHQSQPDIGLDEAIERIEGRMKAMLIMDMPETCGDCPLRAYGLAGLRCYGKYGGKLPDDTSARPADCPLIPARGYIDANGNLISWEDDSDE